MSIRPSQCKYFLLQISIAKRLLTEYNVSQEDIAILTPYSAQKSKLLEVAKDSLPEKFKNLKVRSITESQGEVYKA